MIFRVIFIDGVLKISALIFLYKRFRFGVSGAFDFSSNCNMNDRK